MNINKWLVDSIQGWTELATLSINKLSEILYDDKLTLWGWLFMGAFCIWVLECGLNTFLRSEEYENE